MQGYLLSRPMNPAALVAWMTQRHAHQLRRDSAFGFGDSRPITLLSLDSLEAVDSLQAPLTES